MLPDTLHLLDRADRRGYASILAHMASSDGDISVEELATFEGRLGNALIAPMSRKDLRLELKRPKPISLAAREMSDESLLLALRDALLLAAADGVFEPREKEIITMIAKEAGVSESELDALYTWVDEGWSWMRRGRSLLGLNTDDNMFEIIHQDADTEDSSAANEDATADEADEGATEAEDDSDPTDPFKEEDYDVFEDLKDAEDVEDVEENDDMQGIDFGASEGKKRRPKRRS